MHADAKGKFVVDQTLNTIEQLRVALIEFARRYNEPWLVERHGYQTPAQVRLAQLRVANSNIGELSLAA